MPIGRLSFPADVKFNCPMGNEPNNTEKIFNERLEFLRSKKDLSQEALAHLIEVEKSYFSRLLNSAEKRRKNPNDPDKKRWNIDHIDRLSKALNVPVWQLFVDPSDIFPQEYTDWKKRYDALDADNKRIIDALLLTADIKKGEDTTPAPHRATRKS